MNVLIRKFTACAALALTAGCSSTPMPEAFMNHFSSARQDEQHSKCMADHGMFNNRPPPITVGAGMRFCYSPWLGRTVRQALADDLARQVLRRTACR